MHGIIIGCGEKDSRGADRFGEPRGLLRFGGKEVVLHILEKMAGAGATDAAILVEKKHGEKYRNVMDEYKPHVPTIIEETSGLDGISSFIYGIGKYYRGKPAMVVSDDNLFTFSLAPLVASYRKFGGSILAVRNESFILDDTRGLNFGRVIAGEDRKIKALSHSFLKPGSLLSPLVSMDIWIFHPSTIKAVSSTILADGGFSAGIKALLDNLFCVEINEGFWADVGKPELRAKASFLFGAQCRSAKPFSSMPNRQDKLGPPSI